MQITTSNFRHLFLALAFSTAMVFCLWGCADQADNDAFYSTLAKADLDVSPAKSTYEAPDQYSEKGTNYFEGSTGPTGPEGATGAEGDTGPSGAAGPQGIAGPSGSTGPQGDSPTGPQGPTGPTGMQGAMGSSGPSGPVGEQGVSGPSGSVGSSGAIGPSGAVGPSGADGPSGAQGATGPSGTVGPSGAQGPQGPSGAAGVSGPTGSVGPSGPRGPTGYSGPNGSVGPTGPSGPSGPSRTFNWSQYKTLAMAQTIGASAGADVTSLPCFPGDVVVGCDCHSTYRSQRLAAIDHNETNQTCTCSYYNPDAGTRNIFASAICLTQTSKSGKDGDDSKTRQRLLQTIKALEEQVTDFSERVEALEEANE